MKTFVLLPIAALIITASCSKQPMPAPAQAAASGTALYSPARPLGDTLEVPKDPYNDEPVKIPVKTPETF